MVRYLETESYGKLPVRVSYFAMKKYQMETGKSLMEQFQNGFSDMMAGELEYLLFYALRRGFQVEKREEEFKFTMEDMELVLDETFFDFIKIIPDFFPKETQQEVKTNPEKKTKTKK